MTIPASDMSIPSPEDSLLLIRCPSCGQRFKVGEDLRERTVECGGCEQRFKISDEVIVRGRKVYPGERHNSGLNRFQRVPLPGGESMIGMQPIRYAEQPEPSSLDPVSPLRIIAGAAGVAGMVLIALLLMFGASSGGILDGMVMSKRLMMAGFAGLMGTALLVYANPRARVKALGAGVLLAAGLAAVPFGFRAGSVPMGTGEADTRGISPVEEDPASKEDKDLAALRGRIGTGPLVAEIARLKAENSDKRALGLWLRGLTERNRYTVMDYVLRVTGADPQSHLYPRGGGDFLLVVTGIGKTIGELAELASALGQTEKIYPDISVIEVRVKEETFLEGSIEKLTDRNDPAFYDLNKRELESIDLQRVKRAVQRLAEAEPKVYRVDITRKLIELLGQDGADFPGPVSTALAVWAEKPGPAGDAALEAVRKLVAAAEPVPPEVIALIVKEKNTAVIPILDELWFRNSLQWENLYGDLGQPIESAVIQRFPATKGTVRHSAVRLLGRVGGAGSLPVLDGAQKGADAELKVLLDKARASINSRLGR